MWFSWGQAARDERDRERAHQATLLNSFLASLETIQASATEKATEDTHALVEVAKGMTAQATAFSEWIKLFQTSTAPISSVITEEDEYRAEQQRKAELGYPVDLEDLPPEFQLAYALKRDPNLLGQNEPMTP